MGRVSAIAQVEPLTTARALRGPFDYARPDGVDVGSVLVVPFGRREVVGVVTGLADASEHDVVAPRDVLEARLPPALVDLALWMARDLCSTPARALSLLLPPRGARTKTALWASAGRPPQQGARLTERQRALLETLPRTAGGDLAALRRLEARGLVRLGPRPVRRAPVQVAVGARGASSPLTPDQEAALAAIRAAPPGGPGLLLHGVTGSGKTEVYLHAAAETLAAGRSVVVLVPEIALTPQIVSRFARRFGDTVAVLHSGLSAGERHDEWMRLRRGEARVCVGPRSAVFAPVSDLGLVVVDEEHDPSYKHEGDPRYDARRVAARRAALEGAVLVAGTATPRPESFHALRRLRLPSRVDGRRLPPVEVVDMREAPRAVHPRTHEALVDARKAIVLLNRRGWSNFLSCRSCGQVWECPSCDVTLVLHRAEGRLACHHCGHREPVPVALLRAAARSPSPATARARSASSTSSTGRSSGWTPTSAEPARVLAAFEAADRGVLVGTQMVAKGHDFPDVELGVVLDADATLRFPDFRAEERTFALVTQLAGRAGRGPPRRPRARADDHARGRVDPAGRARTTPTPSWPRELERRALLRYPPFSTLVRVVCSSARPGVAHVAAREVHARLAAAGLGPRSAPRPSSACAAASAARSSSRRPTGRRRWRRSARRSTRPRPTARTARRRFSVDVDPQ